MVRVRDLPGHVNQHVAVGERRELRDEPVEVGLEVLEAVDERAVRAELAVRRRRLEPDQLVDVGGDRVRVVLVRRVEVHDSDLPPERLQVLPHADAVRGLSRARRADHNLAEDHRGVGPSGRRARRRYETHAPCWRLDIACIHAGSALAQKRRAPTGRLPL